MMRKYLSTSLVLGMAVLISACQQTPTKSEAPAIGMANPASTYCIEQGGKLRIEKTASGEVGICQLPDGREVEEWAFFRSSHNKAAAATEQQATSNAQVNVINFVCDNGMQFQGSFFIDEGRAVLNLPTETVDLTEQVTASGVAYTNGIVSFRGKGSQMTLERQGFEPVNCRGTNI